MNIFTYPEIAIAIGQFFPSDPGSQGAILSDPVLGKLRADALSHGWEKAIAGGEEEFSLRSIRNKKGNFRLIGILAKSAEGEWKFCLGVQRETDKPGSGRWQGISPATARKVLDRVEAVAVASELGFDPSSNFVTVNDRGEVGFTAGKPNEIETLAFRAVRAGYRITTGLKKASGFNRARINGIIAGGKAERMDAVEKT